MGTTGAAADFDAPPPPEAPPTNDLADEAAAVPIADGTSTFLHPGIKLSACGRLSRLSALYLVMKYMSSSDIYQRT